MKIYISDITKCDGGGHYTITGSVDGGATRSITFQKQDIVDTFDETQIGEKVERRVFNRLRSYAIANNITNFTAFKNALLGKTFEI